MSRRALFGWLLPTPPGSPAALLSPGPVPPAGPVAVGPPPRSRIAWQQARREATEGSFGPKVAVVSTFACLNAGADFCATCVERCPEPGAIRVEGRRVVVDPAVCNGCGVCVPLCPAPGGAILLRPVA